PAPGSQARWGRRHYVDRAPYVAGEALSEPFSTLVNAQRDPRLSQTLERDSGALPTEEDAAVRQDTAGLLRTALAERCSSRPAMVEVAGIEPASFGTSTG